MNNNKLSEYGVNYNTAFRIIITFHYYNLIMLRMFLFFSSVHIKATLSFSFLVGTLPSLSVNCFIILRGKNWRVDQL